LPKKFASGGHHLASGCTPPGPLPAAVEKVRLAFIEMLQQPG
jgi:hypothetical protein